MSPERTRARRRRQATFTPALGGIAIRVEAADRSVLAWLAEFFAPTLGVVDRGVVRPDHVVTVAASRSRAATAGRRLAGAPTRVFDLFTLDGAFDRHPGWTSPDGSTWVHLPGPDVFVGVGRDARRVEVVAAKPGPALRLATMRVVRELATSALLRAGHLPLHAAAFAVGGDGVAVAGARFAGKTTSLVQALEGGATFLANDRVFVAPRPSPRVSGMATIVMLRQGTLDRFPNLARRFDAARHDRARTLRECAPGVRRPVPRPGAGRDLPGISPAQLLWLTGAKARGVAPLRAILLPALDPRAPGLALRRLPVVAAARRLASAGLKPGPDLRVSELLAAPGPRRVRSGREEAALCRALAAAVPAYACRLGLEAHLADLREALREAGVIARRSRPRPRPRSGGR